MSQGVSERNVNPFRSASLERDTWERILASPSFAAEFVKADTVTTAILTVIAARQTAGLTQSQVAERMETSQSAIARLEKDLDGSMSLARFVDWADACGLMPRRIAFESSQDVQTQALERLQEPIWSLQSAPPPITEGAILDHAISLGTSPPRQGGSVAEPYLQQGTAA